MKIAEYKELKRQAQDEHDAAIALIEKQFTERIAAIETVWKMSHIPRRKRNQSVESPQAESTANSINANNPQSLPIGQKTYGSLVDNVKEAINLVPETFTRSHIMAVLKKLTTIDFNGASVSNRLKRLAKDGVIAEIRKGQGRTPAEYKRPVAVAGEKNTGET